MHLLFIFYTRTWIQVYKCPPTPSSYRYAYLPSCLVLTYLSIYTYRYLPNKRALRWRRGCDLDVNVEKSIILNARAGCIILIICDMLCRDEIPINYRCGPNSRLKLRRFRQHKSPGEPGRGARVSVYDKHRSYSYNMFVYNINIVLLLLFYYFFFPCTRN